MNSRMRQLTVGTVGFAAATSGVMLRFVINHPGSYNFLAFAGSFGHTNSGYWGSPSVTIGYEMFSKIAMSLFYGGQLLIIAAVLAWLFTPQKDIDGSDADAGVPHDLAMKQPRRADNLS